MAATLAGSPAILTPAKPDGLDWDAVRHVFRQHYWVEDKELPEVMTLMKENHGFIASTKQYKTQIERWNLKKNVASEEYKAIVRIRKRRREEEEKETIFTVRERIVPVEKIERYIKRQKPPKSPVIETAPTPSDVGYHTPASPSSASTPDAVNHGPPKPADESGPITDELGSMHIDDFISLLPSLPPVGLGTLPAVASLPPEGANQQASMPPAHTEPPVSVHTAPHLHAPGNPYPFNGLPNHDLSLIFFDNFYLPTPAAPLEEHKAPALDHSAQYEPESHAFDAGTLFPLEDRVSQWVEAVSPSVGTASPSTTRGAAGHVPAPEDRVSQWVEAVSPSVGTVSPSTTRALAGHGPARELAMGSGTGWNAPFEAADTGDVDDASSRQAVEQDEFNMKDLIKDMSEGMSLDGSKDDDNESVDSDGTQMPPRPAGSLRDSSRPPLVDHTPPSSGIPTPPSPRLPERSSSQATGDRLAQIFAGTPKSSEEPWPGFETDIDRRLHDAVVDGDHTLVRSLLLDGADVESRSIQGLTALQVAVSWGHCRVVAELLDNGADVDSHSHIVFTASDGNEDGGKVSFKGHHSPLRLEWPTALHIAACLDDTCLIRLMWGFCGKRMEGVSTNPDFKRQQHPCPPPISAAAALGHTRTVSILAPGATACQLAHALVRASTFGHEETVSLLLKVGVEPNGRSRYKRSSSHEARDPDFEDWTPLTAASGHGHIKIVALLLGKGAAVDETDEHQRTALLFACRRGDLPMSKLLISHGAPVNPRDDAMDTDSQNPGATPLAAAAFSGNEELVRHLLGLGAKVDKSASPMDLMMRDLPSSGQGLLPTPNPAEAKPRHCSPLALACERGNYEMSCLLVDAGANLDPEKGHRPLCAAASSGSLALTRFLLEKGCKRDFSCCKYCSNMSPLAMACSKGDLEMARVLIEHGASAEELDAPSASSKASPLQQAVTCWRGLEVMKFLLEKGARWDGSLLVLACVHGCLDIARHVLESERDCKVDAQCLSDALFRLIRTIARKNPRATSTLPSTFWEDREYIPILRRLLERGAIGNSLSMLHAVHTGVVDIVQLLLDHGLKMGSCHIEGERFFSKSSADDPQCSPIFQSEDPCSLGRAMNLAVDVKRPGVANPRVLELFLNRRDDRVCDRCIARSLIRVSRRGLYEQAVMLVQRGPPISDELLFGCLRVSLKSGRWRLAEYFLAIFHARGFKIDEPNKEGQTLLWIAACTPPTLLHTIRPSEPNDEPAGRLKMIRLLIGYGASPDFVFDDTTILFRAIQIFPRLFEADDVAVIETLIQACSADTLNRGTRAGWTALMQACAGGHANFVRSLLSRGSDWTVLGSKGRDAIGLAAEHGHVSALDQIFGHVLDKMQQSDCGLRPERVAEAFKYWLDSTPPRGENPDMRSLVLRQLGRALRSQNIFEEVRSLCPCLSVEVEPKVWPRGRCSACGSIRHGQGACKRTSFRRRGSSEISFLS